MIKASHAPGWYLLCGAQILLWPGVALAQTGAPPTTQASNGVGNGTGEIIVTAQRRSERLERTPVAIAVLSGDALARQHIASEGDLQTAVPGLQVRTGATANEVNYALRGQSLDQYSSATPGVLPYINEVQISTNSGGGSGATAFYDLQSIQVLKGPQGTLFGRNATAGAVLFTTARPDNRFGGYLSGTVGNYDTEQVEGAVNIPILADKVLTRFAGYFDHHEGYQTNLYDGSHPGTGHRVGLRANVTLRPFEHLSDDLVVDYYHASGTSGQSVLYNLQTIAGATPAQVLYSPYVDVAFGQTGLWAHYLATHTNPTINPNGLAAYLATQQARGPFTMATNDASPYDGKNLLITNSLTYELSETVKYRNIFGYADLRSLTQGDSDGSPYGIAGNSYNDNPSTTPYGTQADTTIFSDENQISGTAFHDLKFTTGLYYSHVRAYLYLHSQFFDVLGGVPSINNDIKQNTTYAAYAQGTYDLARLTSLSGLSLTAGLRYNSEKAERITLPADQAYGLAASDPALYQNYQTRTFKNVSWTVGLQEQATAHLLLYVANRRSYKNGGFNTNQSPQLGYSDTGGDEYRTETVTDIEVGAKFQGTLSGMPTRLNLALFQNWIDNSQRAAFASINGNPSAITVNVPQQQDFGMELDGQMHPTGWLTLGGSLNYIDARFTSQAVSAFGIAQNFATVPDTPRWSGAAFAEVAVPVAEHLTATLHGDLYGQQATFYSSSANINPGARLPGYSLLNFRAGLDSGPGGWSLTANLKNALNKVYYVGGLPLAQLLDYNTALPGAPRTFTIQARYRF